MSLIATCILCQARLPFESSNSWILIRHLLDNHHPPEAMPLACNQNSNPPTKLTVPRCERSNQLVADDDSGEQEQRQDAGAARSDRQKRPRNVLLGARKSVYKTTVTQWKPARFRVKCGECGGRFYPTIRNAASRISNGLGAVCILSCWPFCFLPALFTTASKYHLHCSNCNAYLGLYDVERDCLKEGKA
uniref:LITAF domain-containing protein n=1 Tax=Anopheles melas TaxID=34690 RepID=A0A182TYH7_9DIPT